MDNYETHEFQSGDILYARQLNEMDAQILLQSQHVSDLEYVQLDIIYLAVTPATAEIGSTLKNYTQEVWFNKRPEILKVNNVPETTFDEMNSWTQGMGQGINKDKTFTIYAEDERGEVAEGSITLKFINKAYWGVADNVDVINSAFILGLSSGGLTETRARSISVNAGTGKYIWYAVPTRFGTCKFNVGGFDGGFTKVSTFNHTNSSGYTESYDVYRSDNASLGSTTVKIT